MAFHSGAGTSRKPGPAILVVTMFTTLVAVAAAIQSSEHHGFPRTSAASRIAKIVPVQSKREKDLGLGKVLVASRDLGDENFAETAVLIVHYDEKSVVGLILNRRTDVPVSRVFRTLEAAKRRSDKVYLGGPVEDSVIFALLRSPAKIDDAEQVFGDIYMISSKARLDKTITEGAGPSAFRLYLGYAGWTNLQLQSEVEAGAWHIFQGDAGTVFDSDPDSLWPRLIRRTEEKIAEGSKGPLAGPIFTRREDSRDPVCCTTLSAASYFSR
jgi:putative AlgH/UPF0301 family transcriptional regulator